MIKYQVLHIRGQPWKSSFQTLSQLCHRSFPRTTFSPILHRPFILAPEAARNRSVSENGPWSTQLITKLISEGRISDARKVFDAIPNPDVLAWTAIISGHLRCGLLREARVLFNRTDSVKDAVTWTAMLRGYITANQISEAVKLFDQMPEGIFARNGEIESALKVFDEMPERNVVSWNTVVTALADCGRIEDARRLFDLMPERDVVSWTAIVTGLAKNGRIDEARGVFEQMPERNMVAWNAMVTGYAKNLRMDEAFEMFESMPERDAGSWNAMITGFVQNRDIDRAKKLFDQMPDRDVISWTTLITGYVQDGQSEKALSVFKEMTSVGSVNPDRGTFVSILAACSNIAGICEGRQVHQLISKTIYQHNTNVVSALINMYSKCGELKPALRLFHEFPNSQKDVISWNGIFSVYAHHGLGIEAIRLFEEMKRVGLKPNDVTYSGLLSACCRSGLLEQGLKYFQEIVDDSSVDLRDDHLACLVDLCGRAGRLDKAYGFMHRFEGKPSASALGSLLAGCNFQGSNSNMATNAAKKLLEVEPNNAGTYMLLHNIYASSGKWKEAAKMRVRMKDEGVKKKPGCSWIEVGNRSYVFKVGDRSHKESKEIENLVLDLHLIMKKSGLMDDDLSIES